MEIGNLGEFHSEKLEELVSLEKSVPRISSVAFKFGKEIIHCDSASNRFQPILCHKGILVSILASKWTIMQIWVN